MLPKGNNLNKSTKTKLDLQVFRQGMTREAFIRQAYNKSKSVSSQNTAKYVLVSFDKFCLEKYNKDLESILEELKEKQGDEKYYFMQDYVNYLNEAGRSPKTIRDYFSWSKLYLRRAKGIKLHDDDVRDLIVLPKVPQTQRKPITHNIIKALLDNSKERQKALYLTLLSSGMRLRETLSLRKRDFVLDSIPIKITISAQYTKDREQRETYISREAREILLRIVKNLNENDRVFTDQEDLQLAVSNEERIFDRIRKHCGFDEKYQQTNLLNTLTSYP